MQNDLDIILELVLGLFVAITLLLVILVRLEKPLDRTEPKDDRRGRLQPAWTHPHRRSSRRKADASTDHDTSPRPAPPRQPDDANRHPTQPDEEVD